MRRLLAFGLVLCMVSVGIPMTPAQAQGGGDKRTPTELWNQFPLNQGSSGSSTGGNQAPSRTPTSKSKPDADADGGLGAPTVVLGGLALLFLVAAGLAAREVPALRRGGGRYRRATPRRKRPGQERPPERARTRAPEPSRPPHRTAAKAASKPATTAPRVEKATPRPLSPAPRPPNAGAQEPAKPLPGPAKPPVGQPKAPPQPAKAARAPAKGPQEIAKLPRPATAPTRPPTASNGQQPKPRAAAEAPRERLRRVPNPPKAAPDPPEPEPEPPKPPPEPPKPPPEPPKPAQEPPKPPPEPPKPAPEPPKPPPEPPKPAPEPPKASPEPPAPLKPAPTPPKPAPEPPKASLEPPKPPDTVVEPRRPRPEQPEASPTPPVKPAPELATTAKERAVGYTTFPERKRAVSPEGRGQARRIEATCEARGLILHKLVGDVESHSGPDLKRPGLIHALELLGSREVTCLVVTSLGRLTRSAASLGTLIEWLDQRGARLVVIDIDLDTGTKEGRLAARALARVGGLARETFGPRSPDSLEADDPDWPASSGPAADPDRLLLKKRIAAMRGSGMTLQAIADTLNREGVPTLRGGKEWRPSSVQAATGYRRPSRRAKRQTGSGPES